MEKGNALEGYNENVNKFSLVLDAMAPSSDFHRSPVSLTHRQMDTPARAEDAIQTYTPQTDYPRQ